MKNIERKDLVSALLASRDEIDPELEGEVLEAILDAEIRSEDDRNAAMCAIDVALTAAIGRGVCYGQGADPTEATRDERKGSSRDTEDGA